MKKILVLTSALSGLVSVLSAWIVDWYLFERIAIIGDIVGFQKSFNPGIAFGMHLPDALQTPAILAAFICVAIYACSIKQTRLSAVGFGLILGGGAANIIDRGFDGLVTDMVQIGTFPIFNTADTCITIGVILLLLEIVLESYKVTKLQGYKETS